MTGKMCIQRKRQDTITVFLYWRENGIKMNVETMCLLPKCASGLKEGVHSLVM